MIRLLFAIAALYDAILGLGFLLAGATVFQWAEVTPPNHPGYLQFPAALLLVFAVMFASIAIDPIGKRGLIPYGMLLKVSYCGVVLRHWITTDLPWIWKPFCILDLAFLILFIAAWVALGRQPRRHDEMAS